MKIMCTYLRLATVAFMLSLAPGIGHVTSAIAQSQPPIVLGVVDFELIMKESTASKSVMSQYDKQRSAFDADVERKRNAFKDQTQKLGAQKSTLPDDEFKKKVIDLNAKGQAIEKSLVQAKQALDSKRNKALGQIRSTLLEIIADIAKKRALTLVLNKSYVILTADAYDFTDESMKGLDAKLPSVNLTGAN